MDWRAQYDAHFQKQVRMSALNRIFALVKRYDRKMDAKQQGVLCQQTEQSLWMKAKSIEDYERKIDLKCSKLQAATAPAPAPPVSSQTPPQHEGTQGSTYIPSQQSQQPQQQQQHQQYRQQLPPPSALVSQPSIENHGGKRKLGDMAGSTRSIGVRLAEGCVPSTAMMAQEPVSSEGKRARTGGNTTQSASMPASSPMDVRAQHHIRQGPDRFEDAQSNQRSHGGQLQQLTPAGLGEAQGVSQEVSPPTTRAVLLGPYADLFRFYLEHVDKYMPSARQDNVLKLEQWKQFISNQVAALELSSSANTLLTSKQEEAMKKAILFVHRWHEQYQKAVQAKVVRMSAANAVQDLEVSARQPTISTVPKTDLETELAMLEQGFSQCSYLNIPEGAGVKTEELQERVLLGNAFAQRLSEDAAMAPRVHSRLSWDVLQAKVQTMVREGRETKRLNVLRAIPGLVAAALKKRGLPWDPAATPVLSTPLKRPESLDGVLTRLRATYNAALACLAEHGGGQSGGGGEGPGWDGSKPVGMGFMKALELLKSVDVMLQELRRHQKMGVAADTGSSNPWHPGRGAVRGPWEGDPQALDQFLNALQSREGGVSLNSPRLMAETLKPGEAWLEALRSPATGIRAVTAVEEVLRASSHFKDFAFSSSSHHNTISATFKKGQWEAEILLAERLTRAERDRSAGAATEGTLFPLLVWVSAAGNRASSWSGRLEQEVRAALLRWRDWTQDDPVQTIAAVLEELRLRVQHGARCDLTGRMLKVDGASFEPVPPYTLSGGTGSGLAYRMCL